MMEDSWLFSRTWNLDTVLDISLIKQIFLCRDNPNTSRMTLYTYCDPRNMGKRWGLTPQATIPQSQHAKRSLRHTLTSLHKIPKYILRRYYASHNLFISGSHPLRTNQKSRSRFHRVFPRRAVFQRFIGLRRWDTLASHRKQWIDWFEVWKVRLSSK